MNFTGIWKNLPTPIQQLLESQSQLLKMKRGDLVYRQSDHPRGLYFIEKGLVGLTIIGESSGKEHLLRFFKAGQFFGHRSLFSQEAYHGNAMVLDTAELTFIPGPVILDVLEKNPALYKEIVFALAKELRRAETQHVSIIENQILPRVAQSLIYLKDIHPDHNWTRQEIANFCGSTVSTVIKALAQIEELGLIRQVGRTIEVVNRSELLALQDI